MISQGGPPDDDDNDGGRYRRPPATRFAKGQSGNLGGRPRGRWREAPYEAVLGQMVTIREGGVERRVTATEAFLLQHSKRAVEGDGAATRTTLAVIEYAKERFSTAHGLISRIIRMIVAPGSVTYALMALRMGEKLDPYRETARMVLEPWLVEGRSADHRESHSYTSQGEMAGVVERIPVSFAFDRDTDSSRTSRHVRKVPPEADVPSCSITQSYHRTLKETTSVTEALSKRHAASNSQA